jgi:hypothetical protein
LAKSSCVWSPLLDQSAIWKTNYTGLVIIHKEELAKLAKKVEKFKNPVIFWLHTGFYWKSGKFGPVFFPEKVLCMGQSQIFCVAKWQKVSPNRNIIWICNFKKHIYPKFPFSWVKKPTNLSPKKTHTHTHIKVYLVESLHMVLSFIYMFWLDLSL